MMTLIFSKWEIVFFVLKKVSYFAAVCKKSLGIGESQQPWAISQFPFFFGK